VKLERLIPVFSLTFVVAYQLFDFFQVPFVRYYPSIGRFSFVRLAVGNAIQWYGWMINGLIVALIVTALFALVPRSVTARFTWDWSWIVPLATMGLALYVVITSWWLS